MEQIFYNGQIITMNEVNVEEELKNTPEAVLIKDGIIVNCGRLCEIEKEAGKNVVKRDLKGACLMPSFIDTHSHVVMGGQMAMFADLSECQSYDDIISNLKDYMIKNDITDESVVIGFGYDHNFLKEGHHPDKRVLDKVSRDVPVFILHISAHLACANSAALRLAGINEKTPNPNGGIIGRLGLDNEPSGYVEEEGMNLLQMALMPRVKINNRQILQDIYIKNGITTIQDGASTEQDIKMLIEASKSGDLKVDIVSYPLVSVKGTDLLKKSEEQYDHYINRFRIGGYKLILDGSPQGRTAWLSKPYMGEPKDYCGYPWMKDEEVLASVKQVVMEHKQIMAHCNGDAASEQFISAYEKALEETGDKEELRPVMIHCQTVRKDQLEKMKKLNMVASVFVGHVWYWGDVHMKNLGTERGNYISPVKDAIDKGIVVNFHQDTPVTKPDMLHSVWCAVNRISRNGNVIGEEQAVSVYDALKSVTINSAYQYFEENSKGSIAKGKRADLVILDRSPLETDKMDIRNIQVLETIKDGETIYKA